MRTPLHRIRVGGFVLAVVVVGAVVGFRASGRSWLESLWFVVITISSVGYGERSTEPPAVQLLTIGLVVVGITAAAYTFGGFLQFILGGELDRTLGHRRMTQDINQLFRHTIICGFGRMGSILAAELNRHAQPFVIVELDAGKASEAKERGYLCVHGDATEDDVLIACGVERAKSLASVLATDADNVFITLTARNLNRDLTIIARAEHATSERKMRQAGANRVVMPTSIGAQQMSRIVTRPSTADLMDLIVAQNDLQVELDELQIVGGSKLTGASLSESEIGRRYGLLLLAVKQHTGGMIFNPGGHYKLQLDDTVILIGRAEDIDRFRKENGL